MRFHFPFIRDIPRIGNYQHKPSQQPLANTVSIADKSRSVPLHPDLAFPTSTGMETSTDNHQFPYTYIHIPCIYSNIYLYMYIHFIYMPYTYIRRYA